MTSSEPTLAWDRLPTVERMPPTVARRAHRLFTYDRLAVDESPLVVVVVVDARENLLARSTFATTADPRRVAEHVLASSRVGRYSPYRADSAHRETRIEALVGPKASSALSAYERERRDRPPRTA